jgi:hypothetical protein
MTLSNNHSLYYQLLCIKKHLIINRLQIIKCIWEQETNNSKKVIILYTRKKNWQNFVIITISVIYILTRKWQILLLILVLQFSVYTEKYEKVFFLNICINISSLWVTHGWSPSHYSLLIKCGAADKEILIVIKYSWVF